MSTTTGLSGIGYFQASSEPPTTGATSCSDDKTSGWTADSDGSITDIADGKWICFRAKNSLGVYGYAKLGVSLTKPSFTLSQDNQTVAMSTTTNLAGIGYFEASSEPPATGSTSCSDDKSTGWTADTDGSIDDVEDNKWICFRAKNTLGVYGYAKLEVILTKPSFTLSQDKQTVAMSTTTNLSGIGYFQADSEPPSTGSTSCSDDKTSGWTADSDGSIADVEDGKWICFRAKNARGVYGYAKLGVDLTQPSFTLSQNNTTVAMSTTTGLSGIGYFEASSEPPSTGATSCSDEKSTGWSSDSDGSITGIADNKWICFRAKNNRGVYGYAKLQVDLTKPSFTLSQDNTTVAMSTTSNLSNIGYFTANSEPPTTGATSCSDDKTTGWTADSDGSISGLTHNKWICFRAKNALGVYGYAKLGVDLTQPSFALSQDNTTVAMSTTTGLAGIGYFEASSEPPATGSTSCSDDKTTGWSSDADGSIDDVEDNKWICFRAKNTRGVYGYAKLEVDLTKPSFSLTQDNDTVVMSTTSNLSGIGYFEASSDPGTTGASSCSDDKTTGWTADSDGSIDDVEDNKWICFRAKNTRGVYGYAKLEVDLTPPSFSLSQDNTTVAMSTTTGLTGISYFQDNSEPPATGVTSCSDDKTSGWTADSDGSITGIADGKWICFRAKNNLGVYGYAKLQVDLTKPSFTLTQDNDTVAMSTTTNLSGIGYFEASSEPPTTGATSCSDDKTTGWTADSDGSIADVEDNKWICFRAKNTRGVYGYAQLEVDLTPPSFSLSQDNDTVAMSTTTNLSSIGYFQANSEPPSTGATSCSDDKTTGWTADADGSIDDVEDNKWICFRAKNNLGVYGYAQLEVDLTPPSFSLSQDNTTVAMSTTTNLSGIGYFQANSEPPSTGATSCSDDKTTGWTADSDGAISGIADNKWICFRAKNNLGVYGYAKLEVDLTPPSFSLSQDNDTVAMSTTSNLTGIGYFEASSEPPTTGATSCSDDKTSGWTADADGSIDDIENDQWVCFRAKNNLGVYGYAKLEVDLTKPSFILSQDNTTVAMSTTTGLSGIGYFEASSEPPATGITSCSDDKTTGWSSDSDGSIADVEDNKWICFRAKNTLGVYGYASLEVDLTKPVIKATQITGKVVASTNIRRTVNSYFGEAVSIDGDYMVVGAYTEDGDSGVNTGAVYIFKWSSNVWKFRTRNN